MKIVVATQWFPGDTPMLPIKNDLGLVEGTQLDHSLNRFGFSSVSAQKAIENKAWYTDKHGYDLYIEDKILDKDRPRCWSKIKILLKLLDRDYDYVFWSDIDTLILNGDIRVEDIIESYQSANQTGQWGSFLTNKDIIFGSEWTPDSDYDPIEWDDHIKEGDKELNCGNIIIKNTKWSKKFFRDVYAQTQFIKEEWPWGTEQRAVMHLIAGQRPCVPRKIYRNMKKHVAFLDQHVMNSYCDYGNPNFNETYHIYKEGDWIMHLAGVPNRDHFFDMWFQKWKESLK